MGGLPAIVVPAGFTRVIYDRVPDASDPNGSRLDGPKPDQIPVAMEFLGRPFDEALLFEIASAYEAGTKVTSHTRFCRVLGGNACRLLATAEQACSGRHAREAQSSASA